jgi:hypothetical protein
MVVKNTRRNKMNKAQCLQKANEYKADANKAQENAMNLVAIFGGKDPVVISSYKKIESLQEQASFWERIASMHPQSRASVIRSWANQ